VILLVDKNCLLFRNDFIPYFEVRIDPSMPEVMKSAIDRKAYSGYEVDDFLLGHFEDLGMLKAKNIIDIDMVYGSFSWYIEMVWKNREIQKYIEVQRKEEGQNIYEHFEDIYVACVKISP
jgi:hypothetical protein